MAQVAPLNPNPYAELWEGDRTKVPTPPKATRRWTINPLCGCCSMTDIGPQCCCAVTLGAIPTWTLALDLVGVNAQEARAFMSDAQAAQRQRGVYGGRAGAGFYGGGRWVGSFQDRAINAGNRARELLVTALNLPYAPPNPAQRACCSPCFLCQEIQAVIDFYEENGYNVQYGNILTCECSNLEHNGAALVPPRLLNPGQRWGVTNPVIVPNDAGGLYMYKGYLIPRDADGSAPLRDKDLRARERSDVVTISRGSADPSLGTLPLLAMERA